MHWHSHGLDDALWKEVFVLLRKSPLSLAPPHPPVPKCHLLSSCSMRVVWAEILGLQCAGRICLTNFILLRIWKANDVLVDLKQRYWCWALTFVFGKVWLHFILFISKKKILFITSVINNTNMKFYLGSPGKHLHWLKYSVACLIVTFVPSGHAVRADCFRKDTSLPVLSKE